MVELFAGSIIAVVSILIGFSLASVNKSNQ